MTTTSVTTTIGARLAMNAPKDRPVCPAMRMFGGSPISVAVPPMFDATISIDDQRDRVDVERVGEQERDRDHEQDRRDVVQERREHRGGDGQREDHGERPAARELAGPDRQPRVDARRLGERGP